LRLPDHIFQPTSNDVGRVPRHHRAELTLYDELDGLPTEPRRQDAIEARGRAAPLQMPEHDGPRFLTRQAGQAGANLSANAAEAFDVTIVRGLDKRGL